LNFSTFGHPFFWYTFSGKTFRLPISHPSGNRALVFFLARNGLSAVIIGMLLLLRQPGSQAATIARDRLTGRSALKPK